MINNLIKKPILILIACSSVLLAGCGSKKEISHDIGNNVFCTYDVGVGGNISGVIVGEEQGYYAVSGEYLEKMKVTPSPGSSRGVANVEFTDVTGYKVVGTKSANCVFANPTPEQAIKNAKGKNIGVGTVPYE